MDFEGARDHSPGAANPDVSSDIPQHYIEFRNVSKTFDRPVLKNVSFESFDYRKADWERIQAVK